MNTQDKNTENLTDIVFENRFKQYGAYFLRKSYDTRLITAFIVGLSLMLLLISSPLIASMFKGNEIVDEKMRKKMWTSREIEIKKETKEIEAKKKEEKPKPKKMDVPKDMTKNSPAKGVNFNVKPSDKDSIYTDNLVQDGTQRTGSPTGDTTDTGGPGIVQDTTDHGGGTSTVHTIVQVMPKPDYDLGKWLSSNYVIPRCAVENDIQGTVYVEFVVDENGNISDVVKKNDIGCGCGDKAVETVKRMPAWSPGMQGGQAVKVRFTVPIKIKLSR